MGKYRNCVPTHEFAQKLSLDTGVQHMKKKVPSELLETVKSLISYTCGQFNDDCGGHQKQICHILLALPLWEISSWQGWDCYYEAPAEINHVLLHLDRITTRFDSKVIAFMMILWISWGLLWVMMFDDRFHVAVYDETLCVNRVDECNRICTCYFDFLWNGSFIFNMSLN